MSAGGGESCSAMIRPFLFPTLLLGAAVALSGCETTNEDDWTGVARKPFDQAERTCEEQAARIAEESERPDFFTDCMGAYGWTRRSDAA